MEGMLLSFPGAARTNDADDGDNSDKLHFGAVDSSL